MLVHDYITINSIIPRPGAYVNMLTKPTDKSGGGGVFNFFHRVGDEKKVKAIDLCELGSFGVYIKMIQTNRRVIILRGPPLPGGSPLLGGDIWLRANPLFS